MDKNIGTSTSLGKMGMELLVLPEPKINGRETFIKKKSDDGRGVLIYLTELGKRKRTYQKHCFKI
jgi:hypothetical protein